MVKAKYKEIYKLWWEYLKRSEKYKRYLQWERKVDRRKWGKNQILPLPKKLQEYHQDLWNMARTFGDVHSQSFEEWWKDELDSNLPSPTLPYYSDPGKHIADGMMVVGKEIFKIYSRFRKALKRDPTRDELIQGLRNHMAYWSKRRLYIVVEFLAEDPEAIIKEFRPFLSERRREHDAREEIMEIKGMEGKTTSTKRLEELQRYLDVYDLWKEGLTFLEIIKKIGTSVQRESVKRMGPLTREEEDRDKSDADNYDAENIIRMYRRDLHKAKKIINNVEQGYFPGRYYIDETEEDDP